MHISHIETVIKSLQKSQNTFSDILNKDDDYLALQELPSRQNATNPHDIICGANLRARLGLKYGGQAIINARLELDAALQHFEDALNLVDSPDVILDAEIKENPDQEQKSEDIEKSICQNAAENAVALAIRFSDARSPIEEDHSSSDAKVSTADISTDISTDITIDPSNDVSNLQAPHIIQDGMIENTNPQLPDLYARDETPNYQIQETTFSLRGSIAATILTLVAMVTVGVVYSEPASAAKYFFQ